MKGLSDIEARLLVECEPGSPLEEEEFSDAEDAVVDELIARGLMRVLLKTEERSWPETTTLGLLALRIHRAMQVNVGASP